MPRAASVLRTRKSKVPSARPVIVVTIVILSVARAASSPITEVTVGVTDSSVSVSSTQHSGSKIDNIIDIPAASEAISNDTTTKMSKTDDTAGSVSVQALLLERTSSRQSYGGDGTLYVYDDGSPLALQLVGRGLDTVTRVKFTSAANPAGGPCTSEAGHYQSEEVVPEVTPGGRHRVVLARGLQYNEEDPVFYMCVQQQQGGDFVHQGQHRAVRVRVVRELVPAWFQVIVIVVCLLLSGTFSGLNLGLMSLDKTELKIVINSGTETERGYAAAILPVRRHGNFLLCSILLGNVLVNNTLTIVLDSMMPGGAWAVVGSTLAIVIFGEIIPQAICSRHGLAVGAYTIWLTKSFMLLTSPLAWPLSKLLDVVLGREVGTVYNKQKLMELLRVTDGMNDLQKDEVDMVTGALVLNKKKVEDVMTRIDDAYMLPLDKVLDFETVSEIKAQGYSRIPVYNQERNTVVYILFAKDLMFLDTEDEKTVEEVCKFYCNQPNFVYNDTNLTDMFNEFKTGDKGHMAIVQTINTEGEGDPFHETIGLVTMEDIIEEIIQSEINDETDVFIDNKSKKKRKSLYRKEADLKIFALKHPQHHVTVSPQVSLAVLQFLTTSVKPFYPENFSRRILQKLLSMDVYREVKLRSVKPGEVRDEEEGVIMRKGLQCDFFVLIIEGRVEITIGKEVKRFQEGPFSCFGEQMLELVGSHTMSSLNASEKSLSSMQSRVAGGVWCPDYRLRAVTDVVYLKIRRGIYQLAVQASKLNSIHSESESNMREHDLVETLTKVTKNDADFDDSVTGQQLLHRSPEKLRGDTMVGDLGFLSRSSVASLRNLLGQAAAGERGEVAQLEESFDEASNKTASPSKVVFMVASSDTEEPSRYSRDFEVLSTERSSLLQSEHKLS